MPIISLFVSPAFFSDLPHPASDNDSTTASQSKAFFSYYFVSPSVYPFLYGTFIRIMSLIPIEFSSALNLEASHSVKPAPMKVGI